jgi:hypothetical protein
MQCLTVQSARVMQIKWAGKNPAPPRCWKRAEEVGLSSLPNTVSVGYRLREGLQITKDSQWDLKL